MIFTGFSPNHTMTDAIRACFLLFVPWRWQKGSSAKKAEKGVGDFFGAEVTLFDSGRTALHMALKALGVKEGDDVAVQAYTCVVVINAIKQLGARPLYIDITDEFNMDAVDLEKKLTDKTTAMIIQHTFGLPANLDNLLVVAKKHNLKVVEDCAHTFGGKYKGKKLGTFGDVAMMSFGSDKVISSVRGGAAVTMYAELHDKISSYAEELPQMRRVEIVRHLLHIPFFFLGKLTYRFLFLGKGLLWLTKTLKLTARTVSQKEKAGERESWFPARYPNALASLLLSQLSVVEVLNEHRKDVVAVYEKQGAPQWGADQPLLRFPLLVQNPKKLQQELKRKGVMLGDWYQVVVAPNDTLSEKTGYKQGSCPKAESLAVKSINLPTNRHVSKKDAMYIGSLCFK